MSRILLSILFLLLIETQVFAQDKKEASKKVSKTQSFITKILIRFEQGRYEDVIEILDKVQKKIPPKSKKAKELQGLIYYWRGMCYSRINDYELAEEYLEKAIDANYNAKDIFYEYGQVLYVAQKMRKARIAFKRSVKNRYKMAVSLYYIASISQEIEDYKKAVTFYSMIERLPEEDKKDVLQASRTQIADIYLLKVERRPDAFSAVKNYVIPQYEKALEVDEDSRLADTIRKKIRDLQKKYELLLFKMRNGRPTAIPPYYLKAGIVYGSNDNVTATSEDDKSSLNTEDYSSTYYTADIFTRYSFYPNSALSFAPELSASYTKYTSTSETLLPFNSYFVKAAFKTNFEHIYNSAPATMYLDLDYTYNADDTDADEKLEFASNAYGATLSEEMQIFQNNPSTFRINYAKTAADLDTNSNSSFGFNYEQLVLLGYTTLYWYNNYNVVRYDDESSETLNANAITSRLDAIFPTLWGLFNPTLYASIASTNYIENSDRGVTNLVTYGLNMNRPVGKKLYMTADFSTSSQTGDQDEDNFKQIVGTFRLDYIY